MPSSTLRGGRAKPLTTAASHRLGRQLKERALPTQATPPFRPGPQVSTMASPAPPAVPPPASLVLAHAGRIIKRVTDSPTMPPAAAQLLLAHAVKLSIKSTNLMEAEQLKDEIAHEGEDDDEVAEGEDADMDGGDEYLKHMPIQVELMDGHRMQYTVQPQTTDCEKLLALVYAPEAPPEGCRLIFGGKQFAPGVPLSDYNITHGCIVRLVGRLRGGGHAAGGGGISIGWARKDHGHLTEAIARPSPWGLDHNQDHNRAARKELERMLELGMLTEAEFKEEIAQLDMKRKKVAIAKGCGASSSSGKK